MDTKDIMKLKIGIAILVIGIVVFAATVAKIVPDIKKIPETQKQIQTQTASLQDSKRQLEDLKAADAKQEKEPDKLLKAFFIPNESGLEGEAALTLEFEEIITLLRNHKIKTRKVTTELNPADDNFVRNVSDKYFVYKLDLEMVANYRSLESFLRDLYKHPHFLEISKLEIAPYQKNKRILLTNLQIKLYSQR